MTELLVMNEAMIASAIILAITFIGIFTETLHGFHRAKFAMMGAIMMIIVGQYYECCFSARLYDGDCFHHDPHRRL